MVWEGRGGGGGVFGKRGLFRKTTNQLVRNKISVLLSTSCMLPSRVHTSDATCFTILYFH